MDNDTIARRQQQVLHDQKWHLFVKRAWLFRHLPFVDFVFGSGSLAIGNVDEESDFDVLIGARAGRIFTARFFAALFFGLFGWRRSKEHGNAQAADKVCINHLVTPTTYRLQVSPNEYWKMLYQRLVPIYGSPQRLQQFFDANSDWAGTRLLGSDMRYDERGASWFARAVEVLLGGVIGNHLESWLKKYQTGRIEQGIRSRLGSTTSHQIVVWGCVISARIELPPLIVYTSDELEFHPDPAVIDLRA